MELVGGGSVINGPTPFSFLKEIYNKRHIVGYISINMVRSSCIGTET